MPRQATERRRTCMLLVVTALCVLLLYILVAHVRQVSSSQLW